MVGNLFVSGHRDGRFTKADARRLETLAAYAGIAIANADLYARSQQFAVVEERNRVARELHDAATQTLFSLVLNARAAALTARDPAAKATMEEFEQRTTSALQELRGLVHALRPKSLERDGLAATLADHADALRTSGARVVVDAPEGLRLPLDTEHALLRIAQEAIHNALRHAPGSAVRVTLRAGTKTVTLRDPRRRARVRPGDAAAHTARDGACHHAGACARDRRADWTSVDAHGAGTTITVTLPVSR